MVIQDAGSDVCNPSISPGVPPALDANASRYVAVSMKWDVVWIDVRKDVEALESEWEAGCVEPLSRGSHGLQFVLGAWQG